MSSEWNRMTSVKWTEWKVLDGFCIIGLVVYLVVQILDNGKVIDGTFLILLTIATFFLNYRQKNLYDSLSESEDGKKFFNGFYCRKEIIDQFESIFFTKMNDYFSVLFAVLFCFVMWHFHIWEQVWTVKAAFTFFLFTVNIPTGLAIVRLLKYFYYSMQWINKMDLGVGIGDNFQARFIRKIRGKVLLTAATYCTVSLSSILFTEIELNMIVAMYSIFAGILILLSLTITDLMIEGKRKSGFFSALDRVNEKINVTLQSAIEQPEEKLPSLKILIETKDCLMKEREVKLDLSKVMSGAGLLLITVLPVILQYVMEHLN